MRAPISTGWPATLASAAAPATRPGAAFEMAQNFGRDETRARGIHVAVAVRRWPCAKNRCGTIRCRSILGARHGDVEQPPLLLDLGDWPVPRSDGHAAIDGIEHEHRFPFLALGGMDGREVQIILVEQRHAGLVAGRVRRIERQFGQKPLAGGIALRRSARAAARSAWRSTASSCMRSRCGSYQRRTSSISAGQPAARPRSDRTISTKPAQSAPARGGAGSRRVRRSDRRRRDVVQQRAAAVAGPTPCSSCMHPEAGHPVARVFRPAQHREHVLDMRGFEELQAAEFDEGDVAPGQLDLQRAAMMRGAEQHGLVFERVPVSRFSRICSTM